MTTTTKTPLGTHKNIFCQAVVTHSNAPIVHRIAFGGVLRVDKPKPKETPPTDRAVAVPKTQEAKPSPASKPPAKKPLGRLEQLRQDAAQKAKERAEQVTKEEG